MRGKRDQRGRPVVLHAYGLERRLVHGVLFVSFVKNQVAGGEVRISTMPKVQAHLNHTPAHFLWLI